jgi:hypothetical protein
MMLGCSTRPAVPRDWQDRDGWLALLGYAHLVGTAAGS